MNPNSFNQDDFANLYYRKNKLRDAAAGIMELVSGTGVSICPYMQDETGRYSEERTLATVEALMEALKTYLRFELAEEEGDPIGKDKDGNDVYAYRYYEMPEDEVDCYRGFVYCALRHIYANYDCDYFCEGSLRRVFGDLIDLAAEQMSFRSYPHFLCDRYMKRFACEDNDFQDTLPMNMPLSDDSTELFAETYSQLAPRKKAEQTEALNPQDEADSYYLRYDEAEQHRAFQTYYMATDEEMERMLQDLTEKQKEKAARRIRQYEEIRKYTLEYYEDAEEALYDDSEEEAQALMEEAQALMEEEMRERNEKAVQAFVCPDSFRAHLHRYLHLQHLRGTPAHFLDAVTGMVDFFLLAQGKSCFADPKLFYRTFAQMQRLTQQVDMMMRGSKR